MKIWQGWRSIRGRQARGGTKGMLGQRSAFQRIFGSLLLLFLVLGLVLAVWLTQLLRSKQREQIALSALNQLSAASRTMEQALGDLAQNMGQVLWNSDLVHYMIVPTETSEDSSRDYRIVRQLDAAVDGNALVLQAAFFSPISGRCYHSGKFSVQAVERDELGRFALASTGADTFTALTQDDGLNTRTGLYSASGRLFLIQELDIGNHIGTMVYELDKNALYELINANETGSPCYLYDSRGNSLLRGEGLAAPAWVDPEQPRQYVCGQEAAWSGGEYYYYKAPDTGWQYISRVDTSLFALSAGELLLSFLPVLAALVVFSLGLSGYVRLVIYRPIDRLMDLVGREQSRPAAGTDEFRYLENVYSQAQDRQEHLTDILRAVSPAILENLFRHLIFGREIDTERVCAALESTGDPLPTQGWFVVCVCRMEPPEDRAITEKEWNLYFISLQQMANELATPAMRVCGVRVDSRTLALPLCFGEELGEMEALKAAAALLRELSAKTTELPYRILTGRGRAYRQLTELRLSFEEATARLRYRAYLTQDGAAAEGGEESAESLEEGFGQFYFREQSGALAALAAKSGPEAARPELERTLQALYAGQQDLAECRRLGALFLDEMVERLIGYPLSGEDQQKLAGHRAENDLAARDSRQAMLAYLQERCEEILQMIAQYNRKSRYKYVDQAKEQIAAEYGDSSLSLNAVAERVGISASYLSELFNEVTGEKFSAYLARYRVEKARQLQSVTNLTVKEIGYRCGFNSSQNFIRVYKKYTGSTPGKFKAGPGAAGPTDA